MSPSFSSLLVFFFKQKTAYEISACLVGSEMCIRDSIVTVRYRLIPYLYDTFKKASETNDMIFRPLAFDYPDDKMARECETQVMLGNECMICPVYEQNVSGRYVYLPEDMTFVKLSGENVETKPMEKGVHFIEVALNEVPLFIKKGKQIPLCKPAMRTSELNTEDLTYIG